MDFQIGSARTSTEHPMLGDYPMHIHNDSHEIFCFRSGDAGYSVEGNRYQLEHGDLMLMRKGEVHHLIVKSDARYERSVINFDLPPELDPDGRLLAPFNNRSLGKYNHYRAAQFPDNHWLFYLEKIEATEDPRRKLCFLMPLLSDLADSFELLKHTDPLSEKDRAAGVIKYINHHLGDDLSLELLAGQFYLSKTHLNRIFKQSTGTTVWEYIVVKRLFMARELLTAGQSPTQVFPQCGFQDYTTFYRAYKQHFGISPKNENGRSKAITVRKLEQQEDICLEH